MSVQVEHTRVHVYMKGHVFQFSIYFTEVANIVLLIMFNFEMTFSKKEILQLSQ
jgi:hypothetical protein